jgi:lysophospholipase L1-like esterase
MLERFANLAAVAAALLSVCVMVAFTHRHAPSLEDQIVAFEARDAVEPPPHAGVVLVGSSTFRRWKNAEHVFGPAVLNRGFGGSQMADVVRYADRIVIPYAPRLVIVYEGDNDLAAGKTAEQVVADFRALVAKIHAALPTTRIAVLSIKPSPQRRSLLDEQRRTNLMLRDVVAAGPELRYVDIVTPMLDSDGEPRRELFIGDGLHLSGAGYRIWQAAIQEVLDEEAKRDPDG